jgi:hypothetical protein
MKLSRVAAVGMVVVLASLISAGTALAGSIPTTLYPTGDSVSLGSSPMTITGWPKFGSIPLSCTWEGGTFTMPTKGNSAGPVTTTFTTRPQLSKCNLLGSTTYSAVTSGTWTMTTEYGTAKATIKVPPNGIEIQSKGESGNTLIWGFNSGTMELVAGWTNGFSSPISVGSSIGINSTVNFFWYSYGEKPTTFGPSLSALTDTTHPTSLPLVGPF